MPRLLESEIASFVESDTFTMEFTYHGVGVCESCNRPHFLYTPNREIYAPSGTAYTSLTLAKECAVCINESYERFEYGSVFEELDDDASYRLQVARYQIRTIIVQRYKTELLVNEIPICRLCSCPEFKGSEDWTMFQDFKVYDSQGQAVPVHQDCANRTPSCYGCNKNFVYHLTQRGLRLMLEMPSITYPTYMFTQINEESYCRDCTELAISDTSNPIFSCYHCNEYYDFEDAHNYNGDSYCDACYNDYIYACSNCDELYHSNYGHDCEYDDDDDDNDNSIIHNYSYKPAPEFFGNGNEKYYLGFELEVECGPRADKFRSAEELQTKLGARAYIKEDGSLDNGYEVVTHPHSLEAYNNNFNWGFLEFLKRNGLRSWNTSSCGLHVHVSRTAFDPVDSVRLSYTRSERILRRQAHELRFTKLIYDNQRQVERIAGRSSHFSSFADKGNLIYKVKHGNQSDGRYSAVNTENIATLEVRVFKGSLRPERVRSALEFVHAAVEYTRNLKVAGKNNAFAWSKFVAFVVANESMYPNLLTIINETFATDAIND